MCRVDRRPSARAVMRMLQHGHRCAGPRRSHCQVFLGQRRLARQVLPRRPCDCRRHTRRDVRRVRCAPGASQVHQRHVRHRVRRAGHTQWKGGRGAPPRARRDATTWYQGGLGAVRRRCIGVYAADVRVRYTYLHHTAAQGRRGAASEPTGAPAAPRVRDA